MNSPVLILYRNLKSAFQYEDYLNLLPKSLRFYIVRLRLSVHPLMIKLRRYKNNRTPRDQRFCPFCNTSDIEEDYHFVCICPCFNEVRRKFLKKYYYIRPSMYKFVSLLTSTNRKELIHLSLFVREALSIRKTIVNVES